MIGALRERVELIILSRLDDGGGGAKVTYSSTQTVYAQTNTIPSGKDNSAGRSTTLQKRIFTLRHQSNIDPTMRLKHRDIIYRIIGLSEDSDKRRFTIITGEEVYG